MFVTKKEHEELKNKVKQQEELLHQMMYHVDKLTQEVNELKKPKEPNYFG